MLLAPRSNWREDPVVKVRPDSPGTEGTLPEEVKRTRRRSAGAAREGGTGGTLAPTSGPARRTVRFAS